MAEKRLPRTAPDRKLGGRVNYLIQKDFQTLHLGRKNYLLLGAGLVSVVFGFLLLMTGDINVAPILLLAGYLVLIPWSLVARPGDRRRGEDGETTP